MRNILIIEDHESHMQALCKIISEIEDVRVFKAYNIAEAYYMLSLNRFHLFLVDIVLDVEKVGDVSGLNFVRELRQHKKYEFAPVIFITSLEDPKYYAYDELHSLYFIEKPFDSERVKEAINYALRFPVEDEIDDTLCLRKDGIIYPIHLNNLVCVQTTKPMSKIYTTNDCMEFTYRTVMEIVDRLPKDTFIRCSRFNIINRNLIKYIDFSNRYIKMRGMEEKVDIGKTRKKALMEMFEEDGLHEDN